MYTEHIKSKYCPILICTLDQCRPFLFLHNKHVRLVDDGYNSEKRKEKDSIKATTTSRSFTKINYMLISKICMVCKMKHQFNMGKEKRNQIDYQNIYSNTIIIKKRFNEMCKTPRYIQYYSGIRP